MKIGLVRELIRKFDWILLAAVLLLLCLGLAAIYSVELSSLDSNFSNFNKQIGFGVLGIILVFFSSLINYSAFRVYSSWFYLSVCILLVSVLLWGQNIRGTTGWFAIAGFGFQPVELAKISLIIFLAKFFSNRFQHFNEKKHLVVSLSGTLIFVFLVILQPDFGSAAVLLGIWFILLVLSKIKWRYLISLILLVAIISSLLWFFVLEDYQHDRILTFIYPELDPLGSGYNVSQALIAIGAGNIFGRGLGFGSQSQLKFIPESQTDFVFAVIAEELGLLGVFLVLGLWVVIFYRLIKGAKRAKDDFGMYLLLGVCAVFFIHLMINIGMNLGLMPVTGISLPFVSYGGSFVVSSFMLIGVAQSVIVRRENK